MKLQQNHKKKFNSLIVLQKLKKIIIKRYPYLKNFIVCIEKQKEFKNNKLQLLKKLNQLLIKFDFAKNLGKNNILKFYI